MVAAYSARDDERKSITLFIHEIKEKGEGEVNMRAIFDEGVMLVGMSGEAYERGKSVMGELSRSWRRL